VTPQAPTSSLRRRWDIRFGMLTDPGLARERNEDACAVFVPYAGESPRVRSDALFLVADGMGGHEAGDLASAFVAREVRGWFTSGETPPGEDTESFVRELRGVVEKTNEGLLQLARERHLARGAGSTVTVACLRDDLLHLVHVGDTRLYRLRSGQLQQLTLDHSWVAEQQRAGILTAEEAETHPQRHMLTECLGVATDVNVFASTEEVLPGDRYLLCSDGLHGTVPEEEIARVLASGDDPQEAARELVALANQNHGPDNITAVVVHLRSRFTGAPTDPEIRAPSADHRLTPAPQGPEAPTDTEPTGPEEKTRIPIVPGVLVGTGVLLILGAAALLGLPRFGETTGTSEPPSTQAISSPVQDAGREGWPGSAPLGMDTAQADSSLQAPDSLQGDPDPRRPGEDSIPAPAPGSVPGKPDTLRVPPHPTPITKTGSGRLSARPHQGGRQP
jgi:serine/threonine protein phosphatase PrpC